MRIIWVQVHRTWLNNTMVEQDCLLIVFAKAPISGKCKTRLIPALGDTGAAELQSALVQHTLDRLVDSEQWQTRLCITESHDLFELICSLHDIEQDHQQGRDLGERMCNAVKRSHTKFTRVLIVGTDCPFLTRSDIKEGFRQLENVDCVFAPANDGGYVMVGTSRVVDEIFESIEWGSEHVMQQSLHQAKQHDIEVGLLLSRQDIDRPEDLRFLKAFDSLQAFAREWPSPPGLR